MKWAILTLNKQSIDLARGLRGYFTSDIYTLEKYLEDDLIPYPNGFKNSIPDIFKKYDVIIGIMAMGIIVRDITPFNRHKSLDPAVLCYSVDGRFIIPVLSGHLGGANSIATQIAKVTTAIPVITTASDLLNKKAVDLIAKEGGYIIDSFKDAMDITAKMINNERVLTLKDSDLLDFTNKDVHGAVYIGNKLKPNLDIPYAKLINKNLVLGIGVRRGKAFFEIKELLNNILKENNLDIRAIKLIASIDIKKDEAGIIKLSEELKVPFNTYTAAEISVVEGQFDTSDFVKKITGVGSVSMPSGYLGSNRGENLVKKVAQNGITISIWEEK